MSCGRLFSYHNFAKVNPESSRLWIQVEMKIVSYPQILTTFLLLTSLKLQGIIALH